MRNVWNLLARNRNFRLLVGANLISATGDWIMNIGMTFYVYVVTGSTLAAGVMFLVVMLPQLLFGSLAGVYADRWDQQRTMVVTNLLLALTLVPLFTIDGRREVWLLYVVVFAQGVLSQLLAPAGAATMPRIIRKQDLVPANALNGQAFDIARLLGAAIGGILAATGGLVLVAVIDMISYLVAAALLAMMRIEPSSDADDPVGAGPRQARLTREWLDGLRLCFSQRNLVTLLVYRSMNGFGEGFFSVLFAPFLISVLHAGSAEFGAISAVQAIGGIVGGLAIAAVGSRCTPRQLLGYGALLFGFLDLVIAVYPLAFPVLWPVFALMILVGVPGTAQGSGYSTLLQTETPERFRGRVYGAISNGSALTLIVGVVLAGALGDVIGIIALFSVQGLTLMAAGLFVLARLAKEVPVSQTQPVVLAQDRK